MSWVRVGLGYNYVGVVRLTTVDSIYCVRVEFGKRLPGGGQSVS